MRGIYIRKPADDLTIADLFRESFVACMYIGCCSWGIIGRRVGVCLQGF